MDTGPGRRLRPLGVGNQIDAAFKIYRRRFRTLALCVLVPVVPIAILSALISAATNENAFTRRTTTDVDATLVGGALATGLLTGLLALLATGACTRAVAADHLGESVSWRESLAFAARRLAPLVAVSLLAVLAAMLGLFVLLVGAIYVAIRLAVATPALLVENPGVTGALRRSWELVQGNWWRTFGVLVVSSLLVGIIAAVISGLMTAPLAGGGDDRLPRAILSTLGTVLANVVTLPLQAAVLTVVYFDLRVRREGFDLPQLAGEMGRADTDEAYGGFLPPRA